MHNISEEIYFDNHNEDFITQIGNIRAAISYDKSHWYFNWQRITTQISCHSDWWCHNQMRNLSCIDGDEYCDTCPRDLVEFEVEDSYISNNHSLITAPQSLEDVRQNVMHEYVNIAHNGLHLENLYKIMHSKWLKGKKITPGNEYYDSREPMQRLKTYSRAPFVFSVR